jgi:DNA-binding response OmpR family regulator
VLVADDEPTMLELVTRHLRSMEQPRLEVIEASDGDEAWRLARERLPDLVVLDVMMPGMSGWEVCRKIRQDAALAHTGVLMLTGIGETLNETTSPLFGADEYIDKPFDFETLDGLIARVLSKRAAQRDAVPRHEHAAHGSHAHTGSPSRPRNGVGGPAKPLHASAVKKAAAKMVAAKKKTSKPTKKAKPAAAKAKTRGKQRRSAKAEKGQRNMAAKKAAKKGAKKGARKGAKKGKKK